MGVQTKSNVVLKRKVKKLLKIKYWNKECKRLFKYLKENKLGAEDIVAHDIDLEKNKDVALYISMKNRQVFIMKPVGYLGSKVLMICCKRRCERCLNNIRCSLEGAELW